MKPTNAQEAIKLFREKFVGGKRADPATYEYRVFRNIEAYIATIWQQAEEQTAREMIELYKPILHLCQVYNARLTPKKEQIDEANISIEKIRKYIPKEGEE